VLVVPKAAILDSGERQLVFVDEGGGYFDPREVELGRRGDAGFEVRSGVRAGDKVVVSANFLIDSESLLRASVLGMSHQH
jgi:Cu(I)/Ag(I) efflux system membrane fusion protein